MNQRGVERWVYELATRISEDDEVTVYQNRLQSVVPKYEIKATNIDYFESRKSGGLLRRFFLDYDSLVILKFNIKILRDLMTGGFDVIIPTDGGWEPAIIRILSWIKRRKMVLVGHAGIGWDDANNIWCFPDVFVALSTHAKLWAKKVNPFVRVAHIPDGVDIEKFNPVGEKPKLGLKKPVALCVSALEKGKRLDLVIKAVSKIPNLSLLICGKGELEEELFTFGQRLLGKRFRMASYEFNKMPLVYRSCDIFISASLPSYSFEMVILEALASGLPVVANNDLIRSEIVGEAGILADPENSDEFSKAIKKALEFKWRDSPRNQAIKYSWDVVCRKYKMLFSELSE